jgi:predicted DNA-binding protein YlxM (UPF0122 family)
MPRIFGLKPRQVRILERYRLDLWTHEMIAHAEGCSRQNITNCLRRIGLKLASKGIAMPAMPKEGIRRRLTLDHDLQRSL